MIKKVNKRNSDAVEVTFVLPDDHDLGEDVSVVGDFNDWTPGEHMFVRRSNHTYSTKVRLPEDCQYAFRYYSKSTGWANEPEADATEPSGFGSTNCVVVT